MLIVDSEGGREVVGGMVDGAGGGAGLVDITADAGGGVADFQKSRERDREAKISTPRTAYS